MSFYQRNESRRDDRRSVAVNVCRPAGQRRATPGNAGQRRATPLRIVGRKNIESSKDENAIQA